MSRVCVVLEDDAEDKEADVIFDVLECKWLSARCWYKLLPVANLKKETKYMVDEEEVTFDSYSKLQDEFLFYHSPINKCEDIKHVKVSQLCYVKEIPKTEKFELWKEENGETKGRDCKTGRKFDISASVFDCVERCAREPKEGDLVYINNTQGVCPDDTCFVRYAENYLENDDILLYYAYGFVPTPVHMEKKIWRVEFSEDGDAQALIEEFGCGLHMRLVVRKDCLTIIEPKSRIG